MRGWICGCRGRGTDSNWQAGEPLDGGKEPVSPGPRCWFADAEGQLMVAASAGMDDSTVQSLNGWGEGVVAAERSGGRPARGWRVGSAGGE